MFAYVYCRVQAGKVKDVLRALRDRPGIRRAVAVTGQWDVWVALTEPEHQTAEDVSDTVLTQIQTVPGIVRTSSSFVVSSMLLAPGPGGGPRVPIYHSKVGDCFVHMTVEAGRLREVVRRLGELDEVRSVVAVGGDYDVVADIPLDFQQAVDVIVDKIGGIEGITSTTTFVALAFSDQLDEEG